MVYNELVRRRVEADVAEYEYYAKLAALSLVSEEFLDKLARSKGFTTEQINNMNANTLPNLKKVQFVDSNGATSYTYKPASRVGTSLKPVSVGPTNSQAWLSKIPENLREKAATLPPDMQRQLADAFDTSKSLVVRNYQWRKVKDRLGITGVGTNDVRSLESGLRGKVFNSTGKLDAALDTRIAEETSNATLKKMSAPATDRTGKVLTDSEGHTINQFDRSQAEDFSRSTRLAKKGETTGQSTEGWFNGADTEKQMEQISKKRSRYSDVPKAPKPKVTKTMTSEGTKVLEGTVGQSGGKFMNFLKKHKKGLGIAGTAATALTLGGLLLHSHNEDQRRKEEERRRNNALMTGAIGSLAGAGLGYSMGGGTGALLGGLAGGGLGGAAGYKFSSYGDLQAVSDKLSVHLFDWHSMKAAGRKVQDVLGKDDVYEDFEKEENTLPEHRQFFNTKHSDFTLIPSRWWDPGFDVDVSAAVPAATALAGGIGAYALAHRLIPDSWKAQAISAALGAGVGGLAGYELSGGKMPWQ